jgi:hypothetical protein
MSLAARIAWLIPAIAGCALTGCVMERWSQEYTTARIDEAIARYKAASAKVALGDARDQVLDLLQPTQFELESNEIKPPVAFTTVTDSGQESLVEIHYFRSARHLDEAPDSNGLPPNDDFTPYIFTDGVLTGIGWQTLATLRFRKPAASRASPSHGYACDQLGPLAGCF